MPPAKPRRPRQRPTSDWGSKKFSSQPTSVLSPFESVLAEFRSPKFFNRILTKNTPRGAYAPALRFEDSFTPVVWSRNVQILRIIRFRNRQHDSVRIKSNRGTDQTTSARHARI